MRSFPVRNLINDYTCRSVKAAKLVIKHVRGAMAKDAVLQPTWVSTSLLYLSYVLTTAAILLRVPSE